jgi:hypothetical protein
MGVAHRLCYSARCSPFQFFLPLFSLLAPRLPGSLIQDQGLKTATGAGSVRNCRIDRAPCELPGAQRSAHPSVLRDASRLRAQGAQGAAQLTQATRAGLKGEGSRLGGVLLRRLGARF